MKTDLVQHHVKYKEIHGVDEIVMMTRSEHRLLHNKLRKEGGCNIPADELEKISGRAHFRTEKGKITAAKYDQTDNRKAYKVRYALTSERVAHNKEFESHRKSIRFDETLSECVTFREKIRYNGKTGGVGYIARFEGSHGCKLQVIDIGSD